MKIFWKSSTTRRFSTQLLWAFAWLMMLYPLVESDTYYSVYVLCSLLAVFCMVDSGTADQSCATQWNDKTTIRLGVASTFFSAAVVLANYELFDCFNTIKGCIHAIATFCGGIYVAFPILRYCMHRFPRSTDAAQRKHSARVFCGIFFPVVLIDLGYLFFAMYPGVLTLDSLFTIEQILGEISYNNVSPFYHTLLVELFVKAGTWIFGNVNAGVALFHVAQVLVMAGCFAYAIETMYEIGVPSWGLWLSACFYMLIPYHTVYSITLWKDIPFSVSILLFLTSLYRLLRGVGGKQWINWVLFLVGSVGFSLMRSNGWYAFAATVVVLWCTQRKTMKKLVSVMVILLLVTWILLNPVLDLLHVSGINYVEALSIPLQQVARVVHEQQDLSDQELAALEEIFDLDVMAESYTPYLSDPIKYNALRRERMDYMKAHGWEYLKLYVKIGLRYPAVYLKAWIEQTKGYWNAGYDYWVYALECNEGGISKGIYRTEESAVVAKWYNAWLRFWDESTFFQCTSSIGLFVWGVVALYLINMWKKRKEQILFVPLLVVLIGLWIGTPVFAEFRYAYPIVVSFPLIVAVSLYSPRQDANK